MLCNNGTNLILVVYILAECVMSYDVMLLCQYLQYDLFLWEASYSSLLVLEWGDMQVVLQSLDAFSPEKKHPPSSFLILYLMHSSPTIFSFHNSLIFTTIAIKLLYLGMGSTTTPPSSRSGICYIPGILYTLQILYLFQMCNVT